MSHHGDPHHHREGVAIFLQSLGERLLDAIAVISTSSI